MANDKLEDFKDSIPDYVKDQEDFKLYKIRHSAEHIFSQAVVELFPNKVKRALAHLSERGFSSDAHWDMKVTTDDFKKIEDKMQEIIDKDLPIRREEISIKDAQKLFKDNKFKLEWIQKFASEAKTIAVYWTGDDFVDLCKGPHLDSTADIKAFKLLSVAGAYWKADERNEMLVRVYGTAFATKKELNEYLEKRELAKERDHRKLGRQLDLFTLSDLVGSGLPMFTPRGTVLRDELNKFSQGLRAEVGFSRVWTPHITKTDLYKTSGHWEKFGDELFLVKSQETDDRMVLKPMNCPHHQQIYASKPRSYRDLPLKYMETTTDYRDEKTGELLGLSRVRSLTQDDSHAFVTPDQIETVFQELIDLTEKFFQTLGLTYKVRLSYWDANEPEKYLGDKKLWEKAQAILLKIAKRSNFEYYEAQGEAAFYGPKMDFMVYDALGREWQLATPQLDFNQPSRFGLTYTDSDGEEKTPVMIHYALMGSIERFLSVYIEHTGGAFPAWVAPEQVRIIPISDDNSKYAERLQQKMSEKEIRVEIDQDSERMQAKVRKAQELKVPYMLIVGKQEEEASTVSLRYRDGKEVRGVAFKDFLGALQKNISNRERELELNL
ncbi:MAG: threonine--tRNA ligase [Candidatus Dojkabacteria bacterium]